MDDSAVAVDHAPDVQHPLLHFPRGLSPQVPRWHPGVVHDPRVVANLDLGPVVGGSLRSRLPGKFNHFFSFRVYSQVKIKRPYMAKSTHLLVVVGPSEYPFATQSTHPKRIITKWLIECQSTLLKASEKSYLLLIAFPCFVNLFGPCFPSWQPF